MINESKQTEAQAMKFLNDERELDKIKDIDKSKNQILLPVIAFFYSNNIPLPSLEEVFDKIPLLIEKKKINLQYTKKGVIVNNELVTDWIIFTEKVDALHSASEVKSDAKKVVSEFRDKPLWKGNNITVYKADSKDKCISLGKGQKFCISQPNNHMWQSYRDTKASSFYFIFDENNKDNPLHTVVFDNNQYGIELTDETNDTGTIHKYDTEGYIDYLKDNGVPVDLMTNIPLSEQELEEKELLKENDSLEWFIKLSPDHKSKYIGRGYTLTNKQFGYLVEHKLWDMVRQYVSTGKELDRYELKMIEKKPNILKSYLRTLFIKLDSDEFFRPSKSSLSYLHKYNMLHKAKYAVPATVAVGNNEILKDIIEKGADTTVDDIEQAVEQASYKGWGDVVETLLSAGIGSVTESAVLFAAEKGHTEVIKIFISYGADITKNFNLPLRLAAEMGHADTVKFLIERGADPSSFRNYALMKACENGHLDVLKILYDNKVDLRYDDDNALSLAAQNGHYEMVSYLLSKGSDATSYYNSPIKKASKNGHDDIVELLKKHGAVLESMKYIMAFESFLTKKHLKF